MNLSLKIAMIKAHKIKKRVKRSKSHSRKVFYLRLIVIIKTETISFLVTYCVHSLKKKKHLKEKKAAVVICLTNLISCLQSCVQGENRGELSGKDHAIEASS